MQDFEIKSIYDHFQAQGDFLSAIAYGQGHINDTYLVETTEEKYVLQRINGNVFKNIENIIENVAKVSEHMHKKILERGGKPYREMLFFVSSYNDKKYYVSEDGNFFRMYVFVDDVTCYQSVENAKVFYESARAFGNFQKLLSDFPADELFETIPNFHNTVDRFRQLKEAIAADKVGRCESVKAEIEFALEREKDAGIIVNALKENKIPLRVTHNDTKLNNVLIDNETGRGLCVIDLDTVMPGSMLYDFGDSIRFGASTAAEDETDLNKVSMDLHLFEEYTRGYLEVLKDSITPNEVELLAFSAKLLTLECGIRFLTDYLDGDNYFKIHRPNQNLDRARTQLKLVADMEKKMDKMNEIVLKYAK